MNEYKKLQIDKELFDRQVNDLMSTKKKRGFMMNQHTYDFIVAELKAAKHKKCTKMPEEYNLLKRYTIVYDGFVERLATKTDTNSEVQFIVANEDLWEVLWKVHIAIGHGGRDRMLAATQQFYGNITTEVINLFIKYCDKCQMKKKRSKCLSGVDSVKSVTNLDEYLSSRIHFGLIKMNSSAGFNYVLLVRNFTTKYFHLRPLKSIDAEVVSNKLFDIFMDFDAPLVLQHTSDDDSVEFLRNVAMSLRQMCPKLKMVLSMKQDNDFDCLLVEVESMLANWLHENQTDNWLDGLKYVQDLKTREFNTVTRTSPHINTFGKYRRVSWLDIDDETWNKFEYEDDLIEYIRMSSKTFDCYQTENNRLDWEKQNRVDSATKKPRK